ISTREENRSESRCGRFDACQGWIRLARILAGIALVIVEFGGVVVGLCSLVFLRGQTEATEIAANAALTLANRIANSERAWVEVLPYNNWSIEFYLKWEKGHHVPEGPMGAWPISDRFAAQIKNLGRAPAKIEGIAVRYVRTSRSARDMDLEPEFGEIDAEQFFLLPNSEMAATAILSPESGVLTNRHFSRALIPWQICVCGGCVFAILAAGLSAAGAFGPRAGCGGLRRLVFAQGSASPTAWTEG